MNRRVRRALVVAAALGVAAAVPSPAHAETFTPISGSGSTWSQNALDVWRRTLRRISG